MAQLVRRLTLDFGLSQDHGVLGPSHASGSVINVESA